jgi:hypothetical protein
MIVGSAPNFPDGAIDDIPALGKLAIKYKVRRPLTDLLPFAAQRRPYCSALYFASSDSMSTAASVAS